MKLFTYIQSNRDLRHIENKLKCPQIALDTEFIREDTYYPKLSLVQLASGDEIFLIDILAVSDLSPLKEMLTNSHVEKIIHSARQDNEALKCSCDSEPTPIFDTQLAAAFLGCEMQISYKQLVQEKIGVELEKSHTYSDWLHRPLSDAQINYAAEDVMYLGHLYNMLTDELQANNKREWFAEESHYRQKKNHDYSAQFLDKARHKPAAEFAALKRLIEWREAEAQTRNLPRQWIVNDQCIHKIAQLHKISTTASHSHLLQTIQQIQACEKVKKYAPTLAEIITVIDNNAPVSPTPLLTFNATMKRNLAMLQDTVKQAAQNHTIAPGLIANKKQLVTIVESHGTETPLSGWRAEIMQKPIAQIFPTLHNSENE